MNVSSLKALRIFTPGVLHNFTQDGPAQDWGQLLCIIFEGDVEDGTIYASSCLTIFVIIVSERVHIQVTLTASVCIGAEYLKICDIIHLILVFNFLIKNIFYFAVFWCCRVNISIMFLRQQFSHGYKSSWLTRGEKSLHLLLKGLQVVLRRVGTHLLHVFFSSWQREQKTERREMNVGIMGENWLNKGGGEKGSVRETLKNMLIKVKHREIRSIKMWWGERRDHFKEKMFSESKESNHI